ncbi:MAG: glycosyltransferase family 1 protein [Candidatus Zambryskibacteria bacterium]|nr:glycosyltransferase family 1 protein [Candidatus Zambryskibacteria bacterium]
MKILYGITKSNFGGAQRYVFDLAREAQKAGNDVAVMCGGNGPLVHNLKDHGIRVITLPHMQRDISLIDEFRSLHFIFRTLHEEKPDIFHTNSSKMGGVGNLAARFAGTKKIIFTGHGWAFNEIRPLWQKILIKFFIWLTILSAHQTICVSRASKNVVERWPFVKNKLKVVLNGIEKFNLLTRTQARHALGIHEDDKLVIGTLAELHPVKGLDILFEAWDNFSRKSDAQLVILGDGEYHDTLLEYAQVLGITDSVMFKGYVENARQYLSAFDIFVLPSRSENLPYAILEAGFAGLPIIATNVGGIPEIIETGINGVLIDPEKPDTLFSTLMLLAENKKLRVRLGENLKENILKNFRIEDMAGKTLKLY